MGIALLVIGLLGLVGGIVLDVLSLSKILPIKKRKALNKKEWFSLLYPLIVLVVSGMIIQGGATILGSYGDKLSPLQIVMSIAGLGLLLGSVNTLVVSFILRYYKRLDEPSLKRMKIILFSSIPAVILTFLLFEEGAANAWTYPLANGFYINGSGIGWSFPGMKRDGFVLAWYALFILGGFLVAYFISDHRFYKEYGKHGILETCLIVVFIFGILGARIWYVVGNWNGDKAGMVGFGERVAKEGILPIFAVWEGGLTVLGGVVAGIVSGFIYMVLFRKYVPVTFALDVVVPSILIAQAIGRWGNFFNHEVYGGQIDIANAWWMPTFIQKEMAVGADPGKLFLPFFLIEALLNVAGYFLIAYGVRFAWRKYRAPGVLAGFYMIWYGAVRMVMEPLRDVSYQMGTDGSWSFWNAMIYIILGVAMIGLLQAYEYLLRPRLQAKKANEAATSSNTQEVSENDLEKAEKPENEEVNPNE